MNPPISNTTSSGSHHYNLGYVLFAAAVTAIGGFLFGYDTAVINGANAFLQDYFHLDPETDAWWIGLVTASAILGCIPGAMASGLLSDRFGRRRVLMACAFLFLISAILSAVPPNFAAFIAARVIGGVGIGIASMACPVYIAEISPPAWRGRLGTLFQLGIVTGIFLTLFLNQSIQGLGDNAWNTAMGWRWMLAAAALPAFVFLVLLKPIPESPRWLISVGRDDEARRILRRIGGESHATEEVAAVHEVLRQEEGRFVELFSRRYRLPLVIAFVLMAGSQLSGINAVMYYSTGIFLNASGVGSASSNVTAVRKALGAPTDGNLTDGRHAASTALVALRSDEMKPVLDKTGPTDGLARALEAAAGAPDLQALAAATGLASTEASGNLKLQTEFAAIESAANSKAFSCSVWIGLVNLLATGIAILLVDKAGRKPLLLVGNAVQVVALALVGWLFHIESASTGILLGAVILYTVSFAMAMGPLGWVVCSEIFPAKLRGRAMSVATLFIWVTCNLVTLCFPVMLQSFGPALTFGFFAACSLATFISVLALLPETKGRTLEDIEESFVRS